MRRWIWGVALLLGAAFAFAALRQRMAPPAPVEEEIDDASKQALHEILRQEPE